MLLKGAVKGSIFGMICVLIITLALLFEITGVEVYGFTPLFEITGIEVLPDGVKKNSKVMALPGHFDLPARAGVTEQVTYIGHDSCCYCDEHGDVVKTGARGHVMTFPFRNRACKTQGVQFLFFPIFSYFLSTFLFSPIF